jgi:N-dimethylarginine dimethylaminohydrolase
MAQAAIGPAKKTFLLCRPNFYGIDYSINPWMDLSVKADQRKAVEQWDTLVDRIREHGGDTVFVPQQNGLPDMVFTANAGLVLKDRKFVIISNFLHKERKGEEQWFIQWFADREYQFIYPDHPFEGAGDSLFLEDTLVCGHGFRSDEMAYEQICQIWGRASIKLKLVNPRFYHLDTCFCPLDGRDYLVYPGALEDLSTLRTLGDEIAVSEKEAEKFACNAICIGRTVILPSGCDETMQVLEQKGYKTVPVDMGEFLKSGGACRCLTLSL